MVDRLFLGGYPGAGKTSLARWLGGQGWSVLHLLPETDVLSLPLPPEPLVAEGGFLGRAPLFSRFIHENGFTAVWLTGTKEQLTESRLGRMAPSDVRSHILRSDWIGLVDTWRHHVSWDHEIRMWNDAGNRKTPDEVLREIESRG